MALCDLSTWQLQHFLLFAGVIRIGFSVLDFLPTFLFATTLPNLERRGKHLDVLAPLDRAFIFFNKWVTVGMVLNMLYLCNDNPRMRWSLEQASTRNTIGALVGFYITYDFVYTLLHRALHLRSVYAHIHKHHHHQVVPTRGVIDAINVHPIEFLLGEWNHVLAVWFVSRFCCVCHVGAVLAFLATGGFLAALNHTRHDVVLKLPMLRAVLYEVRAHDVHHRVPQSNYGQYTMFWDRIMGSFKPYDD